MSFPKMSLMQNLKDLVTKGPTGLVNERMKEHLASGDEVANLDRSDPEAMRKYMATKNAEINSTLNSRLGKGFISDENRAHIERLQTQAIDNQAEIYAMLKQHKAGQTAPVDDPTAHRPDQTDPQIDKK